MASAGEWHCSAVLCIVFVLVVDVGASGAGHSQYETDAEKAKPKAANLKHPRSLVLVDGEHYPAVSARGIEMLAKSKGMPVAAVLVGGGEKLGQVEMELPVPLEDASDETESALARLIEQHEVTVVYDLSDEPVLGYQKRFRLASIALWKGASYVGPDFELTPPPRLGKPEAPSVTILGTGKRTGKTAVAGAMAALYRERGLRPVIVAMGRGGPAEPEVIDEGAELDPRALMELVENGRHAASDYIEDALIARVPTVGTWRAGGGLAGAPYFSNYEAALGRAVEMDPGMLLLEGSGASIPPVESHAGVLIVNASIDPEHLCGYLGLYRLLLADLVVLTMAEDSIDAANLAAVEKCISKSLNQPRLISTVFRPRPLGEISGKKVWLATTAPPSTKTMLTTHLEEAHGADVLEVSHSLADRKTLRKDLESSKKADVLLVELKAAAVDVVVKHGLETGQEIVFIENAPQSARDEDLEDAFLDVARTAGVKVK